MLKDATVNRYYYQTHQQLQDHFDTFLAAYNFAKSPKTLHGLTSYQFILDRWADSPNLFHFHPPHLNLGLYTGQREPNEGVWYDLLAEYRSALAGLTETVWTVEKCIYPIPPMDTAGSMAKGIDRIDQ